MKKSRFSPQYARFLERLRALRADKALLQSDLAERLGIPQQYISRFETGETRMDVAQLWFFCEAVGVSFSTLCKQLDKDFTRSKPPEGRGRRRKA